jgi:hypothetical protein
MLRLQKTRMYKAGIVSEIFLEVSSQVSLSS